MADLNKLGISELASGLRSKDFSSEDIVRSCLEEIGLQDGDINSFVLVDEDGAFESARAVDKKLAAGEELSVLAGVPAGIKDLINTKGVRSSCCSAMLRDFVPPYSATVIEKLNEEGMVMLGKTNLDEFACGASTEHSVFGVTKNPYDLSCVAGGSSGGSAASVAASLCTYSLGTDTGGSIRQPASFCGVYGMKPTYGRVSRSGITAMASSWDVVGPFARSVEDIATILGAIAGKDRRDLTTPDKKVPNYLEQMKLGVKGMKIGLPKEYFVEGVDEEVVAQVKDAAKVLEGLGAEIIDVSLPSTKYAVAVYYITQPAELSANLERFDGIRYGKKPSGEVDDIVDFYFKSRGENFGDEIKRRIMIGTYVLSAGYYDAYYKKAQKVRTLIIKEFDAIFDKVDALLAPVAPTPAFKIGALVDDPLAMYMADALTIPASAAGLPALSCPYKNSESGLPIGLQFITPQFEEGRCLQLAYALEQR